MPPRRTRPPAHGRILIAAAGCFVSINFVLFVKLGHISLSSNFTQHFTENEETAEPGPRMREHDAVTIFLARQKHINDAGARTELLMPAWLSEYVTWHRNTSSTLSPSNWKSHKYLILRCLNIDKVCGGLSDRLKPLPLVLLMAYESQRMLYIVWERPAPLEAFLVPPADGINWTRPHFVTYDPVIAPSVDVDRSRRNMHKPDTVYEVRVQDTNAGATFYDARRDPGDPIMLTVMRSVWQLCFVPSAAVQRQLDDASQKLHLIPGHYTAVHSRTMYRPEFSYRGSTRLMQNAIRCGATLHPGWPMFVATDNTTATNFAVQYGAEQLRTAVVSRQNRKAPLHLDKGLAYFAKLMEKASDRQSRHADDYMDVFVDLYLLANAGCVTYDLGGYGHWASLLSHNQSCALTHNTQRCSIPEHVKKHTETST